MASGSVAVSEETAKRSGTSDLVPVQEATPEGELPFVELPPPSEGQMLPDGIQPEDLPDLLPEPDPDAEGLAGDFGSTNDVAADPAAAAPSAQDIDQLFAELAAPRAMPGSAPNPISSASGRVRDLPRWICSTSAARRPLMPVISRPPSGI
ncbi:hypothetical protein QWZ10_04530 [Paracoccus cavernae]|uniref:Uncharacterized protein n=1 Tax=Paracoccus cavernae TaxID=1571207 RepID=A0ABT8D3E5_9RHOB|nr:hypothetical protein [Paracoccus cavernae]